jgi:tetratricopeptide (TPR) repeat protein
VKATIVRAVSLCGALSLAGALGSAGPIAAQSVPEEIPRLMVVPFASNEKGLGAQAAEEIRQRIASDVGTRQLAVVAKSTVCANLEASGFSCDSAPDQLTARTLATSLRTEGYLEGTITKAGNAYVLDSRLYVTGSADMSQPLPRDSAAKLGAIAEQVSKQYQAARKQIPDFAKCMIAVRSGTTAAAIAAADAAILIYPQSTIARLCLANALLKKNAGGDSVLAVAAKVVAIDPRNKLALQIVAEEYRKRGAAFRSAGQRDSAAFYYRLAVQAWTNLIIIDPKNPRLVADIVGNIGAIGMAGAARPIIVKAVEENPGDPDLIKLEWQILLAVKDSTGHTDSAALRQATIVGEQMVRVDTSAADTTFYIREAAAYAELKEPQKAATTVTAGINKFPLNPSLWALDAQVQRLVGNPQGALDAATRLVQLDSTTGRNYLLVANAQIDLQHPDQGVAAIRLALKPPRDDSRAPKTGPDSARALAVAHEDSVLAGKLLLVLGNQGYKAAKAANPQRIEDYKRAVGMLAFADSVAPSDGAKFVEGLAAFSVGDMAVRENQNAKRCDLAREASDYFLTAQIKIAAAGKIDPKTAQQMLGYIQQYGPAVDGQMKKFCK